MVRTGIPTLALLFALVVSASGQQWTVVELPDGPGPDVPKLLDMAVDGPVVWFSTELDGLMAYDGSQWVLHTQAEGGLRHDKYRHVMFVDASGDKWTAKDGSLTIDRLDDGGTLFNKSDDEWTYYSKTSELKSGRVFSMEQDDLGNYWFGIRDEGGTETSTLELLIDGDPATTDDDQWLAYDYYDTTLFYNDDVRGLELDRDGRLWITYSRAGVDLWDFGEYDTYSDDTITHFSEATGLPSDIVRDVHAAEDGRVWVGADGGLVVYDTTSEQWTRVDGIPGIRVNTIDSDAQGHIWVGTDEGAVMLFSSGEIAEVYTTADGLEDDEISLIGVSREQGLVWAVSVNAATGETSLNLLESAFGSERRVVAYPNPWNETTATRFITVLGAPEGSKVEIFDITGEKVRTLPQSREPYVWDSLDDDMNEVASGVYIVGVKLPDGERLFTKVAVVR